MKLSFHALSFNVATLTLEVTAWTSIEGSNRVSHSITRWLQLPDDPLSFAVEL
jgi:hypothetical protein